jgi:hypothetical protein
VQKRHAAAVLREISPARIFARPTAEDLWLGPTQESALSHLVPPRAVRALLGPSSSGRTTLLRRLESQAAGITLKVPGPQRLRASVLKHSLHSAGLRAEGLARDEMQRLLDVFIRERMGRGQRVVIEVDDADGFGAAAWKEVERCWRSGRSNGQGPELLLSLVHIDAGSSPAADFIRSRPSPALAVVSWLDPNGVAWYLHWRLERFGLSGLITPAATRLIARCTRGCFASIDHLCQMALLLLRNRSADQVDVMLVREAMRALQRQRERRSRDGSRQSEARIVISRDGELLHELPVGERLLIGRSHLNDVCLDNSYMSRHHLALFRAETGFYVSDLNSVNGVLLNGQRVHSAPVGDGDVLCLGPYRVKLIVRDETPQAIANNADAAGLADTAVMPLPETQEPAHLKIIK